MESYSKLWGFTNKPRLWLGQTENKLQAACQIAALAFELTLIGRGNNNVDIAGTFRR